MPYHREKAEEGNGQEMDQWAAPHVTVSPVEPASNLGGKT